METNQLLARAIFAIVILIASALFGRSSLNPCSNTDLGTRILGVVVCVLAAAMGAGEIFRIIGDIRTGVL